MARKPRAGTKKAQAAAAEVARSNGLDPEMIGSYFERWDALDQELASERGKFMQKARTINENRKELLAEAKNRGVNPKAFKSEVKCRNLSNKIEAERASLDGEDKEQAELIRKAMIAIETPMTEDENWDSAAPANDAQPAPEKVDDPFEDDEED